MSKNNFLEKVREIRANYKKEQSEADKKMKADAERIKKRNELILDLSKTNPKAATNLIIKSIIESIYTSAKWGHNHYVWHADFVSVWAPKLDIKKLKNKIISELQNMGLEAKIDCEHGHCGYVNGKWYDNIINCDGTSYSTCIPIIFISW